MKWLPLTLSNVNDIDKQAQESINTLSALCDQYRTATNTSSTTTATTNTTSKTTIPTQVLKAITVLRQAMSSRIQALDAFYHDNDLDPRAAKLESTRLRMKKALRDLDVAAAAPSSASSPAVRTNGNSIGRGGQHPHQSYTDDRNINNNNNIGHANANANNNDEMVAVRILMTPQEYEELRRRRDVMRNAHVRSQEYIGGATMSMNNNNNNNNQSSSASSYTMNNRRNVASSSGGAGGGGGSLSWEHAAKSAQNRHASSKLSPPIVRASGQYVTGNTDEDPRLQLSRSRGAGTRLNIGPGAASGHGQSFSQIQSQVMRHSSSASPRNNTTRQINNDFITSSSTGNYNEQNAIRNPNSLQGYRYQSPRVAATGGARSVGGGTTTTTKKNNVTGGGGAAWSSAGVHGMSTDQLDKMRSFGAR